MKLQAIFSLICIFLISFSSALIAVDNSYDAANAISVKFPGYMGNDLVTVEDGGVLAVWSVLVTPVQYGDFDFGELGSFNYTSAKDFKGVEFFSYKLTNGTHNSSIAFVYLGVNNDAPLARDNLYDALGGISVTFPGYLGNDKDPNGDYIWGILIKDVRNGTLSFNEMGNFDYMPSVGFHGVNYFDYVATDGYNNSASARVVLSVNNSAPIAVQDKYIIANSINTTKVEGVLANDSDVDNDELELSITEDVKFGELKTGNTGFSVNGSFNYTSNKTNGVDYFVYELTDYNLSDSAKCVFVIGNNAAPVANADVYNYDLSTKNLSVNASMGVLANDSDAENDVLFAELVNDSNLNGTLTLHEDGSFVYYPKAGFKGIESFTYSVTDLDLTSSIVSVKIYVNFSGIENLTDDVDSETKPGDNITVNFTSEVYPLVLSYQLYNSNGMYSQENSSANNSSALPGSYVIPANLPAGNYSLYLSIFDADGDLINRTSLGTFEVKETFTPTQTTGTGGGGGSSGSCTTQWTTSEWSECVGGTQTRTVSYPAGYCAPKSDKPLGLRACTVTTNNSQTNNTILESEEQQPSVFNTITGNVIGTTAGRWSLAAVLFLILVGVAWWIVAAKKRKSLAEPVKAIKLSSKKKK